MDFSQALLELKAGKRVSRAGWNGKGMWLFIVQSTEWRMPGGFILAHGIDGQLPWVCMKTVTNEIVPWLCSQTDMLADDWGVV